MLRFQTAPQRNMGVYVSLNHVWLLDMVSFVPASSPRWHLRSISFQWAHKSTLFQVESVYFRTAKTQSYWWDNTTQDKLNIQPYSGPQSWSKRLGDQRLYFHFQNVVILIRIAPLNQWLQSFI